MPTFYYRTQRTLEPRPGVKYATTYIKQDPAEYQRLLHWLTQIAESIIDIAQVDADCAAWFTTPMREFKKSQRNNYYSPQDIITDMIDQMAHGRDLTQAMLNRWNRLCDGTPWQIELVAMTQAKPQLHDPRSLFV